MVDPSPSVGDAPDAGTDRPVRRPPVPLPAADDAADRASRWPPTRSVALILIGALMGTFGTLSWTQRPSTEVVRGVVVAIDETGAAILLADADDPDVALLDGRGVGIVGVLWRESVPQGEPAEEWRRTASDRGYPTCLAPEDIPRGVTLGMINDPGAADRPPAQVVAWLECGPAAAVAEPEAEPAE